MNVVTAPTALDIARKELHAAEEAWRKAPPGLSRKRCQQRAVLAERVMAARQEYAASFRAEFGDDL